MEVAAASAMDFHALSRRELQALCKRNGVRANMTNAAMAEALQGLNSVDGIDEIGTTLCLPTPGKSAMKSVAKAAAGEDHQHGSPLPRGRRVSVKSPEAIRMDVEGDDEMKRDLVKEIVRTPGVALRSTSRRARATPAPIPTPATRRSQRTAARKGAASVEEEQRVEVSTAKRTTTRSNRSKMMMDLDGEQEMEKAGQEQPNAVASDVKCDNPEEEEVTKILEGDNKEEEPEEGEEADSSDVVNGSAVVSDKSSDDLKVEVSEEVAVVVEEETTTPQGGIVEEQEPIRVEKSALMAPIEDSPILGILSKAEAAKPVTEEAQDVSVEEMSDEINPVVEDGLTVTYETDPFPKEIVPAAAEEDETSEEGYLSEEKGATDEMPQAERTDDEATEDEDWVSDDDGEASEEIDSIDESDEENETDEDSDCTEVSIDLNEEKDQLVQKLQETMIAEEASEDDSTEDDFSSDLPPEFDDVVVHSDAETVSDDKAEGDVTLLVQEKNQAAVASAKEESIEKEVSVDADVTEESMNEVDNTVDTIVKSLDEFTIKEGTHQTEEENLYAVSESVDAKAMKQPKEEDLMALSMRQLKAKLRKAEEGKKKAGEVNRQPLEEVDDNTC